jgi:aryl-alcohol dehydrogenase-like predicted oxidoreductase
MQFRNLGKSGLRVSLIGLGCNNLGGRIDLTASRRVVHRALDLGISLFDSADIYGTVPGHIGRSALGDSGRSSCLGRSFAAGSAAFTWRLSSPAGRSVRASAAGFTRSAAGIWRYP